MEINKYKEIIAKTAIYPKEVSNFGLAYSWLGLIEEAHESRQAFENFMKDPNDVALKTALIKEIGDVCWYVTNICVLQELNMESVFDVTKNVKDLLHVAIPIDLYAGKIKKYYRDDKPIVKEDLENTLSLLVNGILQAVKHYDITLDTILETNYNKLMKRRETNTIKGDGDNREEK